MSEFIREGYRCCGVYEPSVTILSSDRVSALFVADYEPDRGSTGRDHAPGRRRIACAISTRVNVVAVVSLPIHDQDGFQDGARRVRGAVRHARSILSILERTLERPGVIDVQTFCAAAGSIEGGRVEGVLRSVDSRQCWEGRREDSDTPESWVYPSALHGVRSLALAALCVATGQIGDYGVVDSEALEASRHRREPRAEVRVAPVVGWYLGPEAAWRLS